jgi:leucyl aminopeptidase
MLDLSVAAGPVATLSADAVAMAAVQGGVPPALGEPARGVLEALGFDGKLGKTVLVPAAALAVKLAAPLVVVTGLGPAEPAGQAGQAGQADQANQLEVWRRAAGNATRAAAGQGSLVLAFGVTQPDQVQAVAEGAALGAYAFNRYRPVDPMPPQVLRVAVPKATKALSAALERAKVVAQAVAGARDLVNTAPNELYPATLANAAVRLAKESGLKVSVLELKELADAGYGGIVGVGQGSIHPPCLVKLTYAPGRAKGHVALVGKGITFDSGGLSLKPPGAMTTMKTDMAGAAAVAHTVAAAARLKLPVKVTGWLALAENMPSGAAQHPSDVVTTKSGRTVEVTNTDAEGRLVLADALTAALADKPDAVVDIATLTGAQVVALGNRIGAVMGTDADRDAIVAAAGLSGELMWPMPLPDHLRGSLDSNVANLVNTNMGQRAGGMLTAGLFLREFTDGAPWAHLDVAGPAWNDADPYDYVAPGGTGFGVRTLLAYLAAKA